MEKSLPYIDKEGEVRELDAVDFAKFRPAHEVLPDSLKKKLGVRGPQKTLLKVPTTIRVDADLLEAMRASGKGWQTRANDALRDWMREQNAL